MNKVLGIADRGMTKLHSECGLLDACLEKHSITDFSTYQRGTKVIDYILVDSNVMQCTRSIGYEPFNIHIMSDHRGTFLDLATPQCFGSNIDPLLWLQLQDLNTKRSHQIYPYFQAKQEHLNNHNWHKKINKLWDYIRHSKPNHALAEDLYERLISASIHAGLKLKRFPPAPYSPNIAQLRNVHRLLKLAVTQFKTTRDMSDNISKTAAKLGHVGYQLPETGKLCQQALVRVTRQLKAFIQEELEKQNLQCQHQETLIQAHESAGNTKVAKKIRGML